MPIETKEIRINPDKLTEELETYRCFGWQTISEPEEINEENIGYERRGKNVYQVKETINYYLVNLKRDIEGDDSDKLNKLEEEFNILGDKYEQNLPPERFGRKMILIAGLGLLLAGIPTLVVIAGCLISYPRRLENWEADREKRKAERRKIMEQAKSLTRDKQ